MKFAENLKFFRKERNLTQKELASFLAVTPEAITMWETGKREPSIGMVIKIAGLFKITIDELVGYELK